MRESRPAHANLAAVSGTKRQLPGLDFRKQNNSIIDLVCRPPPSMPYQMASYNLNNSSHNLGKEQKLGQMSSLKRA